MKNNSLYNFLKGSEKVFETVTAESLRKTAERGEKYANDSKLSEEQRQVCKENAEEAKRRYRELKEKNK